MIMMVYYYLPFMVMPLYSSLEKMDIRLVEASFDLGATWGQTLSDASILPLTKRGSRRVFFSSISPLLANLRSPNSWEETSWMFVGTVVSNYILGDETGSLGAAFTVVASVFLLTQLLGSLLDYRSA